MAGFMFACFHKEKAAVVYDALTADMLHENHINCTQINNQTFIVCQNFYVSNAVAMLPGSNATLLYAIWLTAAILLLAHCC